MHSHPSENTCIVVADGALCSWGRILCEFLWGFACSVQQHAARWRKEAHKSMIFADINANGVVTRLASDQPSVQGPGASHGAHVGLFLAPQGPSGGGPMWASGALGQQAWSESCLVARTYEFIGSLYLLQVMS